MAQQIFDKHWPLGKNGANELIPGAAILQTRDGKDEPITLAASFQIGESGLFLPTSKDNPLEVRVRQLEAELQQLRQLLQNGDAQVTLTGSVPTHQGLSTDAKPTLDSADRAWFYEQDTGKLYYWDGSEWVVSD